VSSKPEASNTKLLFPALPVLGVNKLRLGAPAPVSSEEPAMVRLSEDMDNSQTVLTVLVNPVEAQVLIEAREKGILSVALRAFGDGL
ncbi:hypothetical protein, partial [Brachyspira hyodysenteriae]|uniref:hypothetical protein n=1 Tax=Brachyspira hyodysenteriae TaxID=159 RepID=UPI001A7E1336